jgi:hypothetical protein
MSQQTSQPQGAAKPGSKRDGPRKWIPKIGNLGLWLLFCSLSGTGLMLAYRLPPGSRGGRGLSVLGWSRHDWGDLHKWLSFAFLALVVLHMILHWRWFWQIACRKRAWPLLAGILAGLMLLSGILFLPVERESGAPHGDAQEVRGKNSEPHEEPHGKLRFRGGRE